MSFVNRFQSNPFPTYSPFTSKNFYNICPFGPVFMTLMDDGAFLEIDKSNRKVTPSQPNRRCIWIV